MKTKIFLVCIISIITLKSFGQVNGQIVTTEQVKFVAYERVDRISDYCTRQEYEAALNDKNISYERITYFSDSLKVIAFCISPVNRSGKKLPVVIFNRGSYVRNDIAYVHASLFKTLVDYGFAVVAPALRGSEGGEGRDENGGRDVNDLMNILPLLDQLKFIDVSNIFMYGESRGGYMTYLAAKRGFPMRAAATVGALTDMELFVRQNSWMEAICNQIWADFKVNRKQIFEDRSVVHWADKINVPVLILNGNKDPLVKPIHSLNLATKFQELEKNYQLIVVEGGDHILSGSAAELRNESIINWFKKYYKK
jgi:dipeptidyl aminopeptidase/acylaminoacyl peptidase